MEDIDVTILNGFRIVLLGYWSIAEGTTIKAAREAHETEAEAVLYELAAQFSHGGASTDIQLHLGAGGPEMQNLQKSIVAEADSNGILLATKLRSINNVLVPLRDDRHKNDVIQFVNAFDPDSIFAVELYHATSDESAVEEAMEMLNTVAEGLLAREFTESDLEVTVEVVTDAKDAIATKARSHNIVVMGETEELNRDYRIFSSVSDHILEETETPVIIVR